MTQFATSDLLDALVWIAKRDGVPRAERITMDLQQAAKSLSLPTERGARVRELESVGLRGFRQLRKHGFRLVYKSDQKSVIVLAVVHEKRDIATALMSRVKQDPT